MAKDLLLRLTEDQRALLEAGAKADALKLSTFIKQAALKAAIELTKEDA